jgi:hypothetical protein
MSSVQRSYVLAFVLAACGGPPKHNVDASVQADAGVTTLTGQNGFTPTSTVMQNQAVGCSTGVLASGKLDALTVVVADVDLRSPTCGNFNLAVPHVMLLELATGGYFTADPNTANEPIVAGTTFAILDEGVNDEDLCGNVPKSTTQPTAVVMVEQCPTVNSCTQQIWATSGSVVVTGVSPTAVTGTFDLTLGDARGSSNGGTLTGTFASTTCP